jgi:hypothetical protein
MYADFSDKADKTGLESNRFILDKRHAGMTEKLNVIVYSVHNKELLHHH